MMRVAGVNIPDEKKIMIALTYLYGIGRARAKQIAEAAKIAPEKRAKELTLE
ncbi:MAG: 30S ribosomal protein S13, partial [Candidatus Jorgensenbacteria bacterium]|nr:30S ribosomal protein S13 [Candidatus Jorgensenbacteria bacterium]